MRRKKSLTPLGETEMEVLRHVWKLGRATVAEVRDEILRHRKVAYTTVMTVMNNLAQKRYLDCDTTGTSYVYSAAQSPDEVRHKLLSGLLDKVFDGSTTALVQTLVRFEDLSEEEIAVLRQTIDQLDHDAHSR